MTLSKRRPINPSIYFCVLFFVCPILYCDPGRHIPNPTFFAALLSCSNFSPSSSALLEIKDYIVCKAQVVSVGSVNFYLLCVMELIKKF